MVDVTYTGPHQAVEIETKPGVFVTVASGETVTVPDAVAKGDPAKNLGGLLEQTDTWREVKKTPAKKTD